MSCSMSYIQRDGDALRVSTRLLDVADGRQLWAQRYDERFSDILTVQDSIAERVLAALAPNLAGALAPLRRYTSDAEAYHSPSGPVRSSASEQRTATGKER